MDRYEFVHALVHLRETGELYVIAEAIAKAQQDLEHSTDWEVCRTRAFDGYSPEGQGWAPFASDDGGGVYWRRPRPKENPDG